MKNHSAVKSSGFAIGAILMAVVLIAAIAAFLASGSSTNSSIAENQRYGMIASSLISQASDIDSAIAQAQKNGFTIDKLLMQSGACNYDEFCLFDENTGVAQSTPIEGVLETTSNTWVLKNLRMQFDLMGANVVTSAEEWVLLLKDIKEQVCRQINITANHFESNYDAQDFRDGSGIDPTTGLATQIIIYGDLSNTYHHQGCFLSTINSKYYYYRVILTN